LGWGDEVCAGGPIDEYYSGWICETCGQTGRWGFSDGEHKKPLPKPTSDARDAERVWDWLSRNLPKDCRMSMTSYDDNSGGFCLEVYDDARKIWGSPFPELDADWAHPGEAVAMYKRALCLAALAVARRSNV